MFTGGGQQHPFIAAGKQLHVQLLFQLVNAGGDIGLGSPSRFAARVTLRSCATVLKISNVVWFMFLFLI